MARTPTQIQAWFDENAHRLDVPQQMLGDEPNSYRKPWNDARLRMCVFASWPYEAAAGNQAIPLVYKTVNDVDGYLCDRSYFPSTPRDLKSMVTKDIPIFGIESKHELSDFDIIGTSISYPVLTINFIKQLLVSGIPPTWADRDGARGRHRDPASWPFVIVGGQAFGAPEVIANVADCVFCGEAEDEADNPGLVAVLRVVDDFMASGQWTGDRMWCYAQLAREFPFLYFPCFVDVHYGYEQRPTVDRVLGHPSEPSKQVVGITSNIEGLPMPIVKRFVRDLDAVAPLSNPPLLYVNPGMGSGDLETQRGCPAWCSFCKLTYMQKPYRQRSIDYMVEFAKELTKNTGAIHLAPFGPDWPMHTNKKGLVKALAEQVSDDIDASSMRVDDFIADGSFINLQAMAGMDTVTLGVEGNSQRMRDLVGKGAADEDIKEAVARAIAAGIKKVKLYMIAFLPGEETGDIYRQLVLARELADIRDSMGSTTRIQFSWTPMSIEGSTPFQWFAPTTVNFALSDVWVELKKLGIDFKLGGKAQKDKIHFAQLTERASRDIGMAMVEAVCDLDQGCWGGAPMQMYETVEARLVQHGFHNGYADAYDERFKHDMFGWEHIDTGINSELLWVAYQQMREFLEYTDADTYDSHFPAEYHGNEWIERCDVKCQGRTCGVCSPADLKIRREYINAAEREVDVNLNQVRIIDQRSVAMKVRCRVERSADKRMVGNDHFRYAVRRAAYRAGVPLTKRYVRFSSDAIKFRDWTCGVDYLELALTERMSRADIAASIAKMNVELEPAMRIVDFRVLPASAEMRSDIDVSLYDIEVDVDMDRALQRLQVWESSDYVKMTILDKRQTGIVREVVNAKDFVDDLWFVRDGHHLRMRALVRGKVNPYLVYQALFAKQSWIEAARYPATRLGAFVAVDSDQADWFRPSCEVCEQTIPVDPLDVPYDEERCPRHRDADHIVEVAHA